MIKPQSPCRNCVDRHIGCHAACQGYQDFAEKQEQYKEATRHRAERIIYAESQLKKMRGEKR